MSIVHKTETRKAAGRNRLSFVLSDATPDRYGDTIDPNGWELRDFQRNPIALFGHDGSFPIGKWANLRVDGGQLVGDLEPAQKGTSPRIDEIVSLIEQDILVATSVGFMPIEHEPRKGGGIHYKKQALLETSIVGVPANPAALAVAKSLHLSDDTMRLAFGEQAGAGLTRGVPSPGVEARSPTQPKVAKMTTISQRIEEMQADLVREKDAYQAHIAEEDFDTDVAKELDDRVKARTDKLEALKRAEASLAVKTGPSSVAAVPAQATRRPAFAKNTKPGDLIVRSAVVNAVAFATNKSPEETLTRLYPDDEATGIVVKAAVAPATTTQSGWAAELVNTAMTDFLETLRPLSIYPALADAGGGRLAFGPNQGAIKIPSRAATPSIGGSFVGEGAPIPVRRLGLATTTLTPRKMGVISTFTREIARYATPAIEGILRQEILADTALTIDSLLLDAVAADAVRPAGLLNGVTPITATAGGGYEAILSDLRALRAPFNAANAGTDLVLILNPEQSEGFALTPGADGTLGWADALLQRYRVLVSTAVPAGQVIMLRAADFVTAAGDVPEFEMSNEATLHLEDTTPLQIGTTGSPATVAAPTRSLFQTATIAIRMLLDISWAMRRPGMVQTITGVSW